MRLARVLGDVCGDRSGPALVLLAGVHGNEPATVAAVLEVLRELDRTALTGRVVGVAGNLAALSRGQRQVDQDLNRIWSEEIVAQVRAGRADQKVSEHAEMEQLLQVFDQVESQSQGPLYALDLHTSSASSPPFAIDLTRTPDGAFARALGLPVVQGFERYLEGLLVSHLAARGWRVASLEGGGHHDGGSADLLRTAAQAAAASIGLVANLQPKSSADLLASATAGLPERLEVVYRHPLQDAAPFTMEPGYRSFDAVRQGQRLARSGERDVVAPSDGWLLLPLYQPRGEDGFFIAVGQ